MQYKKKTPNLDVIINKGNISDILVLPGGGTLNSDSQVDLPCSATKSEDDCYAPIKDCRWQDKEDGCCSYPGPNAECHVWACPRLDDRISRKM